MVGGRNFGPLLKWTTHIHTFGRIGFLQCGAAYLDIYIVTISIHKFGQVSFKQSNITFGNHTFGSSKTALVEHKFRHSFGLSKITVVGYNFGPWSTKSLPEPSSN